VRELQPAQKGDYTHTHVRFSPDARGVVVAAGDQVTLWDLATGKAVRQFTASAQRQRNALIDAMQAQARAQAGAETAEILAESERQIRALAIHPGGKLIALAHSTGVTLWDLGAGRLLTSLRGGRGAMGGRLAAMTGAARQQSQGAVGLGSPEAAGLLGSLLGRSQQGQAPVMVMDPSALLGDLMPLMTSSLAFSADGRVLSTGQRFWDANTGEEISRGPAPAAAELGPAFVDQMAEGAGSALSSGAAFSPDARMAARGVGQVVRIVDVAAGKEQAELVGHSSNVKSVAYSPDGRHLLSGAEDGAIKLWDLATGKELVSLIALGREDFAAVTPDQYYRISKASAKGVGFRVRDRIYPFEQFDLRFNRPDIVLQRLGAASPETVQSYRYAYERRLKKMGLSEQMLSTEFHVPEIEILTRDVPLSVNAKTLALRVRASDSRYALDRLNAYVNDVPVYGTRGLALREKNAQTHEQEIEVPLLPGRNKIQVSVLNVQGTESLKQTVYTTSVAQFAPPDVYVLAIGVSEYREKTYNLRFAAKDAADLVAAYKATEGRPKEWGKVHALALTDRSATRAEILKAKDWLKQSRVNDLVVVFAAGHGMTDAQSNYYFGTHDIDPRNPASRGLPYDEFEFLLDGVSAMQKLLLLDTCFSGEIEKDQPVAVAAGPAASTRAGAVRMRAFKAARAVTVVADEGGSSLSAAMLRFQQDWFADLRRGTGAAVISSSSGNEYSLEGEQWRNGVFTYAVLQGLKNGMADANKDRVITVSELQAYVIDQVRALTQGGQNPTVRRENLEYDFAVY
jgi:WD40 repeat protein